MVQTKYSVRKFGLLYVVARNGKEVFISTSRVCCFNFIAKECGLL